MEYLFDSDNPYFEAWVELHDVDLGPRRGSPFFSFYRPQKSGAAPLYYAALCGFYDLAEYLIGKYSHQVNAIGGYYVSPLLAALSQEHFNVAEVLLGHGATVNVRGFKERIPLQSAATSGQIDIVRFLLKHNADVKSQDNDGDTALHDVGDPRDESPGLLPNTPDIARLLLQYGADVNQRNHVGSTPLHIAAEFGSVAVARVLLEYRANVAVKNNHCETAHQVALQHQQNEMIQLLSEYGSRSYR